MVQTDFSYARLSEWGTDARISYEWHLCTFVLSQLDFTELLPIGSAGALARKTGYKSRYGKLARHVALRARAPALPV
jgi:hypothetical protein